MSAGSIEVVLVGDVYVQRPDPDSTFDYARQYLKSADIVFGNLETVVADREHLPKEGHGPRTDEWMLDAYVRAGFHVLNLANNPSMYRGTKGLLRTIEVLDKAGIAHGGGGRNLEEARRPVILERNGTKVAFVFRTSVFTLEAPATADVAGLAVVRVATAYETPSPLPKIVPGSPPIIHTVPDPEDVAAMQQDVQRAKQEADVVIVSWHWGVSPYSGGKGELVGYQTEMGRAVIDAGADLVVGHHPHLIQPIEVYKGKAIFYSLANFVHDGRSFWGKEQETILARLVITNGAARVSFVPGKINKQNQPVLLKPSEATDVVSEMQKISAQFKTAFDIGEREVVVRTAGTSV